MFSPVFYLVCLISWSSFIRNRWGIWWNSQQCSEVPVPVSEWSWLWTGSPSYDFVVVVQQSFSSEESPWTDPLHRKSESSDLCVSACNFSARIFPQTLHWLSHPALASLAADAFYIILNEYDDVMTVGQHARVTFLYRQRVFVLSLQKIKDGYQSAETGDNISLPWIDYGL